MKVINECKKGYDCKWLRTTMAKGNVKVHGCLGIYFSVVSFGRARLYGETCKCRKTANRQARRIAKRLGLEVAE